MPNTIEVIKNLCEKHIRGTVEKAIVADVTVYLCRLTFAVSKANNLEERVYINTRVLKHMYDKKPAEEFEFLVAFLHKIIKYPDKVYKNKNPKRGHYIFTKIIMGDNYLCSLELEGDGLSVVTAFRIRKDSYLNDYELLWSWRGDIPSS